MPLMRRRPPANANSSARETPVTMSHYTSDYRGGIYGYQHSMDNSVVGRLEDLDKEFYIKGLVYYISWTDYIIGIIILAIAAIGFILMIYIFRNTLRDSFSKIRNSTSTIYRWNVPSKAMYGILAFSIILIAVSFLTASLFSFIYSEMLLFLGLYLFAYSLTKILLNYHEADDISQTGYPHLPVNILMAGFFMSYLVFFSAHLTKADRYFTSMAPGFIFLLTFSVETLMNRLRGVEFKRTNLKYAIPLLMMLLMLAASVHYMTSIQDESLAIYEKNTAKWIGNDDGVILSDRGPSYTWYLQKEVQYARFASDSDLLDEELQNASAKYYITLSKVNLTNYSIVKEFGSVKIYGRI